MAVNTSRSMQAELEQGIVENTFMQLQPDWSLNANPPTDRLSWPTYAQAMRHPENAEQVIGPITPRESAPPGSLPRPQGGQGSKFSLIQSLNAG